MSELVEIELMPLERELILKYGYPFGGERRLLESMVDDDQPRMLRIYPYTLEQLVGNLSISINSMREQDLERDDPLMYELNDLTEFLESRLARAGG